MPTPTVRQGKRSLWIALAILAAIPLSVLVARTWLQHRIEADLHARIDRRLQGSGFQVRWADFSLGLLGEVELHGLQLTEGPVALVEIGSVRADLAVLDLLRGKKRCDVLEVEAPVVRVTLQDGRPTAWLRLQGAWRKHKTVDDDDDDDRGPTGLRRYATALQVRGGSVAVALDGALAQAMGQSHLLGDLNLTVDLDSAEGEASARLPASLGGGMAKARLRVGGKEGRQIDAKLEPPLQVAVPRLHDAVPAGLRARVRGMAWQAGGDAALTGVELADDTTTLVSVARTSLQADRTLSVDEVTVHLPSSRLLPLLPAEVRQNLSQALGTLPDLAGTVRQIRLTKGPQGWRFWAHQARGQVQAARVAVAEVRATSGPHLELALQGPRVEVPRSMLARWPDLTQRLDKLATLRGPAEQEPEDDPVDDADKPEPDEALDLEQPKTKPKAGQPDAAQPGKAPPKPNQPKPNQPVPNQPVPNQLMPNQPKPNQAAGKKPVVRERPAVGWLRDLQAGHTKLMGSRKRLEALWPLRKLPDDLHLRVDGGEVVVLGQDGKPLVGIHDAWLLAGPPEGATRSLQVGGNPFDRKGAWGRAGLAWQRHASSKAHDLRVDATGAGLALLLASRLPGASVGAGADIDLHATIHLPDDQRIDAQGRLDAERLGIHWWRLADRPIDDFRVSMTFQAGARLRPGQIWFRTPDIRLSGRSAPSEGDDRDGRQDHMGGEDHMGGDARMNATADITSIESHPRIALKLTAPMQDCGTMLAAVPRSLTPTIGHITAHGQMGWHVGLQVSLPNVGAVDVDLALADTPCTVDQLGAIDLTEFLAPDWQRPVNENGKILHDVPIGPGSGSWTPLTAMPQFVYYAMWATEDSFYRHRGLSERLLEKAIAIDLSTGRFTYGGSTITQQLVKNLYLKRTKALSRKFEEMLIVWQMEKVLGKLKILEIYVNGVEFGPKVYGITRAAWEFFQKRPGELRPKEAVYLGIIKPSPRSGWGTMRANGWGEWYEMKVTKYMDKLLADGSITQEDYDADFPFKPAFNPPPRGERRNSGSKAPRAAP